MSTYEKAPRDEAMVELGQMHLYDDITTSTEAVAELDDGNINLTKRRSSFLEEVDGGNIIRTKRMNSSVQFKRNDTITKIVKRQSDAMMTHAVEIEEGTFAKSKGLSSAQAAELLLIHGHNVLPEKKVCYSDRCIFF
jgi:hypothetical protein